MSNLTKFSRRSVMLMPLALAACKPGAAVFEIAGLTMGTSYNVVAVDPASQVNEKQIRSAIDRALHQVNLQMSNWDDASEISRFNAQKGLDAVAVSPALANVMQAAEAVHIASEGRFDTTMGPLIELWGFGAPGSTAMPADAQIHAAQQRSGHGNTLKVGSASLQKTQSDAQVYLAAIGKGYGADAISMELEALGLTDYMVEIGGDLRTSGRNAAGMAWQIGIEKPDAHNRGVLEVVGVSGHGLASSGDYRNYFEKDGQRFSHVIDPATGRPIEHKTASVTVLAKNAMLADAWATAMLILGRERGMEIADAEQIGVMFVERADAATDLRFKTTTNTVFDALTA
ncbi:MAG: FAD:protein FMN transferase [Sulfitobacter sp.]